MVDCFELASQYVQGMTFAQFMADHRTYDAVLRRIEVAGEAVRRLPDEFCAAHPEVEWRAIKTTRNFLIHNYDAIAPEIVWRIAVQLGPQLIPVLRRLAEELPEDVP